MVLDFGLEFNLPVQSTASGTGGGGGGGGGLATVHSFRRAMLPGRPCGPGACIPHSRWIVFTVTG